MITYILNTLSTEHNRQAFTHASGIFNRMCSMQVSESAWWRNYDLSYYYRKFRCGNETADRVVP